MLGPLETSKTRLHSTQKKITPTEKHIFTLNTTEDTLNNDHTDVKDPNTCMDTYTC